MVAGRGQSEFTDSLIALRDTWEAASLKQSDHILDSPDSHWPYPLLVGCVTGPHEIMKLITDAKFTEQ